MAAAEKSGAASLNTTGSFVDVTLDSNAKVDTEDIERDIVAGDESDREREAAVAPAIVFPDGGLVAWLQVVSGFFLMCNTWGLINTFGVFETYYTSLDPPLASDSDLAWIGSIQSFLLLFVGAFCGRAFDAGYARTMTIVGTILLTLGMLFTSFSGEFVSSHRPEYYQVFLAQGVCCGLGMGLLFLPSVAIAATYFNQNRGLAVGIVTAGSSIGGVAYPIMMRNLVDEIGFSWAVRALTLVISATLCVSCLVIRQRRDLRKPVVPGERKKPMLEFSALKEAAFAVYLIGLWFGFLGLYTPYFYLEQWAVTTGVNLKGLDSFYLLSIMNAFGVFGRIIPNRIADYTHRPILTQAACVAISGLLTLCWIAIDDFSGTLAYDSLYGFFSGAFVSLPPAAAAHLTADFSRLGARMGMMFSITSFATLIGTPITGQLIEQANGWDKTKIFSGVVVLGGGGIIAMADVTRHLHTKRAAA